MISCDKIHAGLLQVDVIRAAEDGVRSEDELEMDLNEGILVRRIKFLIWLSSSASL
jgi:hypothetical protein